MKPTTTITPRVYHLATTRIVPHGLESYLEHVGAADWTTDADDDHAKLVEVAGRTCYRSFGAGLNKNVTRVREGNENYVGSGILGAKHGSVLEHAYDTFALVDVSRVLTHELVRHRQGTAFSQESGRYVRIDQMKYYEPHALQEEFLKRVAEDLEPGSSADVRSESWIDEIQETFRAAMKSAQHYSLRLEKLLGLDELKDFGLKKKLQSAIRRVAPEGRSNAIIVTANHRAWRHIVSMRTDSAAEEEIRLVQYEIFRHLDELHPSLYQDAVLSEDSDSLPVYVPVVKFLNEKV